MFPVLSLEVQPWLPVLTASSVPGVLTISVPGCQFCPWRLIASSVPGQYQFFAWLLPPVLFLVPSSPVLVLSLVNRVPVLSLVRVPVLRLAHTSLGLVREVELTTKRQPENGAAVRVAQSHHALGSDKKWSSA